MLVGMVPGMKVRSNPVQLATTPFPGTFKQRHGLHFISCAEDDPTPSKTVQKANSWKTLMVPIASEKYETDTTTPSTSTTDNNDNET